MIEQRLKIFSSYIHLLPVACVLLLINLHKPLKILKVSTLASTSTLYFSSVTNPLNIVPVLAPQEGVLEKIYTRYGNRVYKNELLFNVKSLTLENTFRQNVQGYIKAKAAREKTQFNYNGNQELYKLGLISKVTFMDQEGQLKDSEYALIEAEQVLKNTLFAIGIPFEKIKNLSERDVDQIKLLFRQSLSGIKIYAPQSGILLFSSKTLGTGSEDQSGPLKAGNKITAGQALGVIANMNGLILKINLNEIDFHAVKVGNEALVTSSAFPGLNLKGIVSSIDHQATGENFNAPPTYTVYVTVPVLSQKEQALIEVGMTAQVALTRTNPPTIQVPISAVLNKNGNYYVNVFDSKTHIIKETLVTPGTTDAVNVEILHGLKNGDSIVLPN